MEKFIRKMILGENKMINVELTRFRVKDGKSTIVDEWLSFLNSNMNETLITCQGQL